MQWKLQKNILARFSSLHVKDEIKASSGNERYESTILGAGIVNVKEVIDFVRKNSKAAFIISLNRNRIREKLHLTVRKKT